MELTKGSHATAQQKAVEGMDVWTRLIDEPYEPPAEEMDVDEDEWTKHECEWCSIKLFTSSYPLTKKSPIRRSSE